MSSVLYDDIAQVTSRYLTQRYSTSFSLATRSFPAPMRQHIYNIYGIVRLADEIVDTYAGPDADSLLDALEAELYSALHRGYSANIIVQAFVLTARQYHIEQDLIAPFFASMRLDAPGATYTSANYTAYIHGSAEVVGLMCLRVFCNNNQQQYDHLRPGAAALGAAFQKINFLRDLADDYHRLGRFYFPSGTYDAFDDQAKQAIIDDIKADLACARPAIQDLPTSARPAVAAAAGIFTALLQKLETTPAATIKRERIRLGNGRKLWLFTRALLTRGRYV